MAFTTPLPEVPESRVMNNIGSQSAEFLLIPGTNDYPTGGYVISAAQCRLTRILGVSIDGFNTTANNLGFIWNIVLGMTLGANNIPNPPTSFNVFVANIVTSVITQLANGTNLAGSVVTMTVTGY